MTRNRSGERFADGRRATAAPLLAALFDDRMTGRLDRGTDVGLKHLIRSPTAGMRHAAVWVRDGVLEAVGSSRTTDRRQTVSFDVPELENIRWPASVTWVNGRSVG